MKCERCGCEPKGRFDLHDYCAVCSKNLCAECMKDGWCKHGKKHKHEPAKHGEAE